MAELMRFERLRLQAAETWLELDDCVLAKQELEKFSHHMQVHPEVLRVRDELVRRMSEYRIANGAGAT
jgi:hypothetical protein